LLIYKVVNKPSSLVRGARRFLGTVLGRLIRGRISQKRQFSNVRTWTARPVNGFMALDYQSRSIGVNARCATNQMSLNGE
jgi:hypothetical protein